MSVASTDIRQTAIDTIRTLSMDAVQTANSGHPGTPMALAPVAYQIFNGAMQYDPVHPHWPNRDRFVLSCGHASMLLYSVLHLIGVRETDADGNGTDVPAVSLDAIRNFRQPDSVCAGHPEFGFANGIETTTGPLGQGVSNSVGMAMATEWLAANFNTSEHTLFDNNVYALCSDGDLMEGIACEAASIAGHLGLSNLCWLYDDNNITIEGETDLAFSEDMETKFKGLGWNVLRVTDANDLADLDNAINAFKACDTAPTLIIVNSIIGFGAPTKANTHGAHGAPLGWDEIEGTKENYGWPTEEKFLVPDAVRTHFDENIGKRGADAYAAWQSVWAQYQTANPEKAAQLTDL
ncbi:MAG: transketolase, partial [Planctomycetota bacterium]